MLKVIRMNEETVVHIHLSSRRAVTRLYHMASLIGYTMQYNSMYLTCSKKLTASQLSLPQGINKKLKCETKNNMVSVIGPVQSRCREAVVSGKFLQHYSARETAHEAAPDIDDANFCPPRV